MQENSINYAQEIMSLFRSIQKNFRDYMFTKTREHGFTTPQLLLIFELSNNPGIKLNDLSDKLELSKSTVSGIIDRLEAQGVVERKIPQNNRRIVELYLTEEFLEKKDILRLKEKYFLDIAKNIESEEAEKIIYALERLNYLTEQNK